MNPDLVLGVMSALTDFVLKTALAFGVCLGLSWLVKSPARRFLVWSGFLYGTAAYWFWMAKSVLAAKQVAATALPAPTTHSLAQPAMLGLGAFPIPGSWALPLGMALRVIGIVYLLVLSYLLVTQIKKHLQLKWVLGFTSQPPKEIAAAFQPLAENLGVGRSRLLVLSGVTSPATFGFVRPTILLPDVCLEQDRSDLEVILRHELHHVRRWDFLWNGLAVACRAILFFHPACWYAVKRMQFDRELACDLAAVSDSPKGRAKYAECLIHFARLNSSQDCRNWGIDFAASSAHLQARVHSILAGNKKPSAWLIGSRIACGLVLLAGFVSVAPSLGVLLSFAQRQIAQPSVAEISTTPSTAKARVKTTRRSRLSKGLAPTSSDTTVASVTETPQTTDFSTERNTESQVLPQSGGPQLLHRGSATPGKSAKQQTVIPIDDASGQVSKAGDHDHNQALQQMATAAAVLKRVAALDRH
jgi:beta-lactamase regulating signal transducer with metallopeptidase domain